MSRYGLIHHIFNSVSPTNRGLNSRGDHLVRCFSCSTRSSGIPTYATLEKLSETELLGVAKNLGIREFSAELL
jgi:hypothetical protein